MLNTNNGENLQLLSFDAGSGPETKQLTTWSALMYVSASACHAFNVI